ncbi:MAG: hypothetical protein JXQ75_01515 [Phycisphaerae bacterium]|nr:hypothetical protein [Phycisphaerae bacterium]
MSQERPGQTLEATALGCEPYIRLVDVETVQHWGNWRQFFSAVVDSMR